MNENRDNLDSVGQPRDILEELSLGSKKEAINNENEAVTQAIDEAKKQDMLKELR